MKNLTKMIPMKISHFALIAIVFKIFCPALSFANAPCDEPFTNHFNHILMPPEWTQKSAKANDLFRMATSEHWRLVLASDSTNRITLYSPEWGPNSRLSAGVFHSYLVGFQNNSRKADDLFKYKLTLSTVRIQFPKEGDLHDIEIAMEFRSEIGQLPIVTIEYRHRGQERKPKLRIETDLASFYEYLFNLVNENAIQIIQNPELLGDRLRNHLIGDTPTKAQMVLHQGYRFFGAVHEEKTTIEFQEGLAQLFPSTWKLLVSN